MLVIEVIAEDGSGYGLVDCDGLPGWRVDAALCSAPTLVWSRDERADVDEVVDAIGMPVSGLGDGDTAE